MKENTGGEGLSSYQAMLKHCRRCPYLPTCAKPCDRLIRAVTPKEEVDEDHDN